VQPDPHRARRRLADQLAVLAAADDDAPAARRTVEDGRKSMKRSAQDGQVMSRWARAHHGTEEAR